MRVSVCALVCAVATFLLLIIKVTKSTEFYSDFENGVSGIVKGGSKLPQNTISIKLTTLVEAEELTGYYAEVIRELDKKKRY